MSDDLIAEALTEHFGPRCPTRDADDFPDLDVARNGRYPCCEAWEQYDGLRADVERLTAALADERRHADVLAEALERRDGGAHDRTCCCNYFDPSGCDCGHVEAEAALAQHRARRQG